MGQTNSDSLHVMLQKILALETGEALVFSPSTVLANREYDDSFVVTKKAGRFCFKARIRGRISDDGGKRVLAG